MNKQNIMKIKMFLMGLEGRFTEDSNIFKGLYVTYKAGLKTFKGIGKFEDGKIKYNFNGTSKLLSIKEVLDVIAENCVNYDEVSIIYKERGLDITITGDNKNVKMSNKEVPDEEISEEPKEISNPGTSTLLNRDYYIKVGKADALLKEIGIMSKDGKIKNNRIRKYNQIDHYVELLEDVLDTLPQNQVITILDCGCGKSYLSFVLNYYLTEVKRRKCHFIGIDISEGVIESSKKMAENLGYRNMEFLAMDIKEYKPKKNINVVISLHACDTATDMALALDCIIAVPCCQKDLLSKYKYEPFKEILKHGILKRRMADVLTEGMRTMMLEANGYKVSALEYISPLETPKNLMIRAIRTEEENPEMLNEYVKLMSVLNAYPALYAFLNEEWMSN